MYLTKFRLEYRNVPTFVGAATAQILSRLGPQKLASDLDEMMPPAKRKKITIRIDLSVLKCRKFSPSYKNIIEKTAEGCSSSSL